MLPLYTWQGAQADSFPPAWQLDVNRQRITTVDKKVVLENDEQLLTDSGVKSGDQLEIKDLGPQIGKRSTRFPDNPIACLYPPYPRPAAWKTVVRATSNSRLLRLETAMPELERKIAHFPYPLKTVPYRIRKQLPDTFRAAHHTAICG